MVDKLQRPSPALRRHSLSEEELLQAMDDYDVDFENGLNEEDIIKLVEVTMSWRHQ